jgi:hypothetical protein
MEREGLANQMVCALTRKINKRFVNIIRFWPRFDDSSAGHKQIEFRFFYYEAFM